MAPKIQLLAGEQIVLDSELLTLTTNRVRYQSTAFGSSELISITLDSVSSCALTTKSYPILFLVAAVLLGVGFILTSDIRVFFLILGLGVIISYFMSRQAAVSIDSNGGRRILVSVKKMKSEAVIEFIDTLEHQKLLHIANQK